MGSYIRQKKLGYVWVAKNETYLFKMKRFISYYIVFSLLKIIKGCLHVLITRRHTLMRHLSSYKLPHGKKQGKENVGTSYVLLLGDAILLAFHFLWSYCMSSNRLRNLIYAKNWHLRIALMLPQIYSKNPIFSIINHLSIVHEFT